MEVGWCRSRVVLFKALLLVISCDVSTNYIYEIQLLGWSFPWKSWLHTQPELLQQFSRHKNKKENKWTKKKKKCKFKFQSSGPAQRSFASHQSLFQHQGILMRKVSFIGNSCYGDFEWQHIYSIHEAACVCAWFIHLISFLCAQSVPVVLLQVLLSAPFSVLHLGLCTGNAAHTRFSSNNSCNQENTHIHTHMHKHV